MCVTAALRLLKNETKLLKSFRNYSDSKKELQRWWQLYKLGTHIVIVTTTTVCLKSFRLSSLSTEFFPPPTPFSLSKIVSPFFIL